MKVLTLSWGPLWDPKSIKIGSKSDPKGNRFYDQFEDRFLERFGANLAPSWPPKPSQNGPKLASKSMQVGVLIWELFLEGCWLKFYWFFTATWHGRSSKTLKNPLFFSVFQFLVVVLLGWFVGWFLIDFWSIFHPKINQKSIKISKEIIPTTQQPKIEKH